MYSFFASTLIFVVLAQCIFIWRLIGVYALQTWVSIVQNCQSQLRILLFTLTVTKNCLVSILHPNELLWIGRSFKPELNEKPCQLKTLGVLFVWNINMGSFALNRSPGEFKSHKTWEKLTISREICSTERNLGVYFK